ncbi:tape measure protein [Marinobacterium stanieri]|uniref:Tape measure domain-containing protein n=1 Tax=Marinobacterium stanieri TaxID=49186 RepID=A0A1N6RQK9_9GAMM|nr:tape measure protein [Marinobacterium stanieri]SIQ31012.1 tape measure domain-containing protein [Marinobacterium stanieri]
MADKNLELALKIKADLQQAIQQVSQLEEALDKTVATAGSAGGASSNAARGIGTLGAATASTARQTANAATSTRRYDAALDQATLSAHQMTQANRQVGGGFTSLAASVKAATLTVAAGFGLNQIITTADAWTAFQNRLRLVTDTQEELGQVTQDVYGVARSTSQQLDSTAAIYQRFAQNADRLNITQEQTAALTLTVSQAVAISGGSAASAEAAMVQFGQALASGVLRGEEFNSVMEQAPGLAQALADGLGKNIGQLREMANAGQLTTDVLVQALESAAEGVTQQFGTRVKQVSQSATELHEALTRLVGTLSTEAGSSEGLADGITLLADGVDRLTEGLDILGVALQVALILSVARGAAALKGLSESTLDNIAKTRANTLAVADHAKSLEGVAVSANRAAVAELERSKAAVVSAQADVQATAAEAKRAAAQAQAARGLGTQAALEAKATQAANAHAAAQVRLDAALEARTVATGRAAAATATLTQATHASTAAATQARIANSLFLSTLNRLKAAGASVAAALGGPFGIAVAVGLLATSFIDFGADAEAATQRVERALEDLQAPLDKTLAKLEKISKLEQNQALKSMATGIEQIQNERTKSAQELAQLATPDGDAGGWLGSSGRGVQATGWSTETKALLLEVRQAAAKAAQGIQVDFDQLGEAVESSGDLSEQTKTKMLGLMEALIKDGRKAADLTGRLNELKGALDGTGDSAQSLAAIGPSADALKAADQYLSTLQRQFEGLQDLSAREQALAFLRKNQIDVNSDLAQNILALATANDALRESRGTSEDDLSRADRMSKVNTELDNQLARLYMLKPEREAQVQFDRIEEQLLGNKITLSQQEAAALQQKISLIRQANQVQSEMDRIYNETIGLQTRYNAAQSAADRLLSRGVITQAQYNRELVKAKEGYLNQIDPMRQINRQIQDQARLLKLPQKEREIEAQMIQLTNQLLREGIDLREDEAAATRLRAQLESNQAAGEAYQQRESIRALVEGMPGFDRQMDFLEKFAGELRRLWEETNGALLGMAGRLYALNSAFESGALTAEYYNNQIARLNVESAELLNTLGFGNNETVWVEALGHVLDDFTTMASGLADILGRGMGGWVDGLADGLARAAIEGKSLRETLGEVARTVAVDMLRALIKLGIQWMINRTLADASLTASVAKQVVAAGQVSSAWSPAAALASLATSGANATSANAAIVSTMAVTSGMASQAFAEGGYTGPGSKYQPAGIVHAGEYVQPQERMREPGAMAFMEAFRRDGMDALQRFQGYADGGAVSAATLATPPSQAAGRTRDTIQVINAIDPDDMAQTALSTPTAVRQIKNIVKAEKSSFRAILES